jgi:purine-nucleoside phosphorylase
VKLDATYFERVQTAARAAAGQLGVDADGADVAVVLGSGLGGVAERLTAARSVPYAALPGFPETTVAGHPGRLVAGSIGDKTALLLCGRVHGYEGYPPREVGFGVRVVAALGVQTLIVTNAAGAVDPSLAPGEIVAISDHINLTSASPLSGPNDERLGPRFVDMTDAYDPALRALAAATAPSAIGRPLREAIYAGMAGPAYETPAEVRLLRTLGAGLVGMSTVHEVITARHAGLAVLGLSLVANPAAGVAGGPLRHEDVTRAATAGADALGRLIAAIVGAMPGAIQ